MKVACFSVATMDYYPQQKRYCVGGNSLNQAVRFGQLGHDCAFVGAIGTDEAGDHIAALLRAASVDRLRRRIPGWVYGQLLRDEEHTHILVGGG